MVQLSPKCISTLNKGHEHNFLSLLCKDRNRHLNTRGSKTGNTVIAVLWHPSFKCYIITGTTINCRQPQLPAHGSSPAAAIEHSSQRNDWNLCDCGESKVTRSQKAAVSLHWQQEVSPHTGLLYRTPYIQVTELVKLKMNVSLTEMLSMNCIFNIIFIPPKEL